MAYRLTDVCNTIMARSQDIILMIFLSSPMVQNLVPSLAQVFDLIKRPLLHYKPSNRDSNPLPSTRFSIPCLLTPKNNNPVFPCCLMALADGMTEGVEMAGEIKKQKQKKNKMNVESNLGFKDAGSTVNEF